jgi:hypothetical protein
VNYFLIGRVTRDQRRLLLAEAEVRPADGGEACATATGKFFPLRGAEAPLSHEDFCPDPKALSPQELFQD